MRRSFINIQPDKGIEISILEIIGDKVFVRLYETLGKETDFVMTIKEKTLKGHISPFGIFEGWI